MHQLHQSWNENAKNQYIKHALRENTIHQTLVHPNIVKSYDIIEIDPNTICIVLEFCEGPDLSQYLKQHKQLSEKDCKCILRQILSGLRYLHEHRKKIIHYDLKPQNILFHKGISFLYFSSLSIFLFIFCNKNKNFKDLIIYSSLKFNSYIVNNSYIDLRNNSI